MMKFENAAVRYLRGAFPDVPDVNVCGVSACELEKDDLIRALAHAMSLELHYREMGRLEAHQERMDQVLSRKEFRPVNFRCHS